MIRSFRTALLIPLIFSTATVFGQSSPIQFSQPNVLILELLETIKAQTETNLIYSPSRLPNRRIVLEKRSYQLPELLLLLQNEGLSIREEKGRYLIVPSASASSGKVNHTITGFVRDSESGEALIGANLFVKDVNLGVSTNRYGFYSLTLPAGTYEVVTSYIGYDTETSQLELKGKQRQNLSLTPSLHELGSITINSRSQSYNIQSMVPSINTLDFNTDNHIPYFMGEVDVFQGALLLPGIRNLGEQASGINVRGGGIDENLILLDEAPIYNPNHYFGLISVFNPEAVNDIQFYKGFFPPSYGGRASSVVVVHQKEGNDQEHKVEGGIGLLSARIMAEGPISKGKSSFLVSARQSLLDPNQWAPNRSDIDAQL
ncbi:MAG: TonB-dependent receptor, partial [Bacteroidota bacterium]